MANIKFPKIDLESVKGVLLDLDNTLYPYEPAHQTALKSCYDDFWKERMSLKEFKILYRKQRDRVTNELHGQGACRSRLLAFMHMLEEIDVQDGQQFTRSLFYSDKYWDSLCKNMVLSDSAHSFLKECHNRRIPVTIVTDMLTRIQIHKIQRLGIESLISYLVTSEEVGVEKPTPEIFHYALSKMNLCINDVIMIGDSPSKDIKGASNLGIKSYLIEIEK
jgi:FMN phosphatase YigB (HAD superfamily)